jgi:hypothetical protein
VRKILTITRSDLINCAIIAREKHTALRVIAAENEALLLRFHSVLANEFGEPYAEEPCKLLHVALRDPGCCDFAAVGALPAVHLLLDIDGDAPELRLNEVVPLQVFSKAGILISLLLAKPANLNQIGNHKGSYCWGTPLSSVEFENAGKQ